MTVRQFRSTDTGAPTLSGTAGDLVNLLDKILIDGYNSTTVTITRSGAVATVSHTSHGYSSAATAATSERRVKIAGANETEYNGEVLITYVDANTYTYPVSGSPASPATGTITSKRAPLAWGTAFTATNKRAFRAASGNRHYLRVLDDGTTSAAYGRIRGYETMSDVDTGTGLFPTDAQISGGAWMHKSSAASATTRPWFAIGDEVRFYLVVDFDSNATSFGQSKGMFFGEIASYKSGDAYHTLLIGSTSATPTNNNIFTDLGSNSLSATVAGYYLARTAAQTGTSVGGYKWGQPIAWPVSSTMGATAASTYPDVISGGILAHRLFMQDATAATVRGEIVGCWNVLHSRPVANYTTWTGAGALAGKTFILLNLGSGTATVAGCCAFETSDTWT